MRCTRCGADISAGAFFCGNCGAPVNAGGAPYGGGQYQYPPRPQGASYAPYPQYFQSLQGSPYAQQAPQGAQPQYPRYPQATPRYVQPAQQPYPRYAAPPRQQMSWQIPPAPQAAPAAGPQRPPQAAPIAAPAAGPTAAPAAAPAARPTPAVAKPAVPFRPFRVALTSMAFAISFGLVFALVTLLCAMVPLSSFSNYGGGSGIDVSSLGIDDSDGMASSLLNALVPSLLTMIALALSVGLGGTGRMTAQLSLSVSAVMQLSGDDISAHASLDVIVRGGLGLVTLGVMGGAIIGAHMAGRTMKPSAAWKSMAAAALEAGIMGAVLFLAIEALAMRSTAVDLGMFSVSSRYTAFTAPNVIIAFLVMALGCWAGALLARVSVGRRSARRAFRQWNLASRGAARSLTDALRWMALLFGVGAIVYSLLLVLSLRGYAAQHADSSNGVAQWFVSDPIPAWVGLIPQIPLIALYMALLCMMGRYHLDATLTRGSTVTAATPPAGDLGELVNGVGLGSLAFLRCRWFLVGVAVVFLILTVYLAIRIGRRLVDDEALIRAWDKANADDPETAQDESQIPAPRGLQWRQALISVAVMTALGAICHFVFLQPSVSVGIGGLSSLLEDLLGPMPDGTQRYALTPMLWCILLPGAWMLVVEVLGRTLGRVIARSWNLGERGRVVTVEQQEAARKAKEDARRESEYAARNGRTYSVSDSQRKSWLGGMSASAGARREDDRKEDAWARAARDAGQADDALDRLLNEQPQDARPVRPVAPPQGSSRAQGPQAPAPPGGGRPY